MLRLLLYVKLWAEKRLFLVYTENIFVGFWAVENSTQASPESLTRNFHDHDVGFPDDVSLN